MRISRRVPSPVQKQAMRYDPIKCPAVILLTALKSLHVFLAAK